jgi:hypothetical protein
MEKAVYRSVARWTGLEGKGCQYILGSGLKYFLYTRCIRRKHPTRFPDASSCSGGVGNDCVDGTRRVDAEWYRRVISQQGAGCRQMIRKGIKTATKVGWP